jgi:hypothetical protein
MPDRFKTLTNSATYIFHPANGEIVNEQTGEQAPLLYRMLINAMVDLQVTSMTFTAQNGTLHDSIRWFK